MKRRHLLLFLLAASAFLLIAFFAFKKALQNAKLAQILSNIKAVNAALISELDKGNANLEKVFSDRDRQWQFLTPNEYDRVIVELAKSHNLDPATNWNPSLTLLDPWGNRFEIGYRELTGSICDTIVVSKGPDGVYGNEDDLVSNYGASPPVKPKK